MLKKEDERKPGVYLWQPFHQTRHDVDLSIGVIQRGASNGFLLLERERERQTDVAIAFTLPASPLAAGITRLVSCLSLVSS